MRDGIERDVRFNFTASILEAGFFGLGLGFASYVTVIPLFVASLTDSSILIGLIAAMRLIGWQLPQLLTANRVARLRRYKPMVLVMTLNERLPFFALALVALALPTLGRSVTLVLVFTFVIWQALGGGLTATAWQTMTAKIIPDHLRGRFYGTLSSASNLMSSGGAIIAGLILVAGSAPQNFALCFLLAGLSTLLSFSFLTRVREHETHQAQTTSRSTGEFWRRLIDILRRDRNFRLFIGARAFAQVASVGTAFFTVYAVRGFQMDAGTAGLMTGVLLIAQVFANPLFGWLGDRFNHRHMFAIGALLAGASAAAALFAPSLGWFYIVFALAGFANAGLTPTIYALTLEFGSVTERPYYIGLANTLIAPATLLAPIIGGWLADTVGFQATFATAAISGVLTTALILFSVRDPATQNVEEALGAPSIEQV